MDNTVPKNEKIKKIKIKASETYLEEANQPRRTVPTKKERKVPPLIKYIFKKKNFLYLPQIAAQIISDSHHAPHMTILT